MKNFKRLTAIVLAFVIIALTLPTISVFAADADARYGRTKLSTDEQYVYDALVVGCKDAKADIKIDITGRAIECTQEHLGKIYDIFYSDYPEYFWVTNGWGAGCAQNGSTVTLTMQPVYSMTGSTLNTAKSKYEAKVSELTNGLSGKSDYEKSKIIHDRVIDTVTYVSRPGNDQNAYNALVEGKAVCNGYARAYQHLMNEVGIPTWFVTGSSINPNTNTPEPHAWNLAKIDGQWYYTDVTWDDQGENTFYEYLNITTSKMAQGHTLDADYAALVPQATATDANFYKKEGREFSGYDQAKLVSLLKKDNNKTQIYIDGSVDSFVSSLNSNLESIATDLGATGSYSVSYNMSKLSNALIINMVVISGDHTHSVKTTVAQKDATCLSPGTKTYYICDCGLKFLDQACTQQITDDKQLNITAKSHTPSGWKNDASNHWTECTKCGSETINTRSAHSDNNKDNKCDTCGYALPVADSNGNIVISGGSTDNNSSSNSNNQSQNQKPNNNNTVTSSTNNDASSESEAELTTDEDITIDENIIVDTDEATSTYEESYLYSGGNPDGTALKWIIICGVAALFVAAAATVAVILINKKRT